MTGIPDHLDRCSIEEKEFYYSVLRRAVNPINIYPQYEFIDMNNKQRRIDFAIVCPECGFKLAVELDGSYHMREQFEDDRIRQNALQLQDWKIIRFTWRQTVDDPLGCRTIIEKMVQHDPHLKLYAKYRRCDPESMIKPQALIEQPIFADEPNTMEQDIEDEAEYIVRFGVDYHIHGAELGDLSLFDMALEEFNEAIKLAPHYADAYASRGDLYAELSKGEVVDKEYWQKAINDFSQAIKLYQGKIKKVNDESDIFAVDVCLEIYSLYLCRAYQYGVARMFKEAVEDCTTAINIKPKRVTAYVNRAYHCSASGQKDQEFSDYNKIIDLEPIHAWVYCKRASIYAEKGLFRLAIEDCNAAIKLNKDDTLAYWNRAKIYEKMKENELALADYEKCLEIGVQHSDYSTIRSEAETLSNRMKQSIL